MKPGSSDRCKSKNGVWRCHRHKGHDGKHQAPHGAYIVLWTVPA